LTNKFGVADVNDAFPNDTTELIDTDSDAIGNNADTDDDGDGILDVNDPLLLNVFIVSTSNGGGIDFWLLALMLPLLIRTRRRRQVL